MRIAPDFNPNSNQNSIRFWMNQSIVKQTAYDFNPKTTRTNKIQRTLKDLDYFKI